MSHEFVETMPRELEEGRLYISIRYRTASHLCPCGCGSKVITPIKPAKWQLLFDGDTVSLTPSIGSWQKPCKSHYWIRRDRVVWAKAWTHEQIEAGRERDAHAVQRYYAERAQGPRDPEDRPSGQEKSPGRLSRIWSRLKRSDQGER